MPRLLSAFVLSLCFLTVAGCDSWDESAAPSFLPDEARYAWSLESRLVETDSLVLDLSDAVRVQAVSRDASVPGYDGLTEVHISMVEPPVDSAGSRAWYEQSDDRLRDIAYANAGGAVIAQARGGRLPVPDPYGQPYVVAFQRTKAERGDCCDPDSVIVREDPRVVYELPLEVGQDWVSFTDPFLSAREVVGRETVAVEAGTFDCFVIRTSIGVGAVGSFEWLDYVSPARGLVLRTTEGVYEDRDENGLPLGFVRTTERLELTSSD